MKRNLGFTLAEVLITLAIIGVVAAMTVPTLMTSTRGKEYEVGANKALSTIANAITMRIALEGVAPANFAGGIGQYLLQAPGRLTGAGRTGEQGALPSTFIGSAANTAYTGFDGNNTGFLTNLANATLKDGMIVAFPVGTASDTAAGGCSNTSTVNGGCMITIDTNGVKGPTRTAPGAVPQCLDTPAARCANWDNTPTAAGLNNVSPDVIQLRIRDTVVEPANQRTRNILATGNSSIAQ